MSNAPRYPRIATFKSAAALAAHLEASGIRLDFDTELSQPSPLSAPFDRDGVAVGNRFCVLPMEGWDGTADGAPSDLTRRRWQHFGQSGAKLIWGGEAVAVRHDGRANPNQLVINSRTETSLAALRDVLMTTHRERFGAHAAADLLIGLQLTHSGRYSRPNRSDRPEPHVAYHHPYLDRRFAGGVDLLQDDDLDRLADDFIAAAAIASRIGFAFVDLKHCHGYLGHELLSARHRPGRYGGSFANRTRFLRQIIEGIRATSPGLKIGVRLSAVDSVPFRKSPDGTGVPEVDSHGYDCAFGLFHGQEADDASLNDARQMMRLLVDLDVRLVCITAGTPYYNPHVLRPALFPPSDGYEPPEDPLRGVARHIQVTAQLKREFPQIAFVGSGYTYLQEWLPYVAQHNVRRGLTDFVGVGRMVLAYPDFPADVLAGRPLARKRLCRTFSDCTTGPRLGLVSGCYPLDPFYVDHPHAVRLREVKNPPAHAAPAVATPPAPTQS
jgi:2,4-dienoyl-CoA reductase-like NADH-dependent reductase (Old Yellow Enzyme family)